MNIVPLKHDLIPAAAELFTTNFNQLRAHVPILPERMADPALIAEKLRGFIDASPAFAVVEDGQIAGYIGAYLIDGFRSTDRKAAYCPEWGHSLAPNADPRVYRALYRAVSAEWFAAGCQTHAISLLTHDPAAENVWFWQGFGMAVVDALRPLTPVSDCQPQGYTVRQATADDILALVAIEAEHALHYAQPPVFMVGIDPRNADEFAKFLDNEQNSAWIAVGENGAVWSYMQFEGQSFGAADIVSSTTTTAITGAYTLPACRGRGAAVCVLNAALAYYAARDFDRCSVDFESFNPEAAHFWLKYFEPVCYSLMRVPERAG